MDGLVEAGKNRGGVIWKEQQDGFGSVKEEG